MNIQGKGCLVSGGASGLGAATARALVAKGARVVIADRAKEPGEALARELGDAAVFAECDVLDEAALKAAVDLATSRFGALSIVAGCAGIGFAGRVLGKEGPMPLDWFKKTVEVNLVGMFNLTRLAAAAMQANPADEEGERGVIVLTASVAAYDGQIGQAAYSASKAGVVGMTLPIARELARFGVRVLTIAPGIFDTPMLAALPEDARKSLGAQVPFPPRLGRPPEFAALVCHIAENTMLNGETIRLDGAIRMAAK
ncbi:MAG: SDR family NAD(P)-dependent oxidoreductase [Polyangiaceae bacterium]|nr:SDR family NAD(P)-dependent oxidoreductase [Polyangiaceae bacterium]